jgi:hypothetical protein
MSGKREREQLDPVSIPDVECIAQTERAIRVVIAKGVRMRWIPQSQITPMSEVYQLGDRGTLIVTAWFAEKEGLGDG